MSVLSKDEIAARAAEAMWAQDRASKHLGMELVSATASKATLRMKVRAEFCNGHAICHGGFIFTLADSTFAFACNSHNKVTVANNCAITFVAAAKEGDVLTANAVEVHRGGRSGVTEVEVRDQTGKLVALFRGHSTQIKGELVPGLTPEEPRK
ncbi:MAG: hydroxyphenylacetyl-CoA thioesterase PaaI [Proteobacteria bacterium]|nr:hydroxyphenylacetyl-CoA thioesterase PaaI [Pseudomonadota bacterium]